MSFSEISFVKFKFLDIRSYSYGSSEDVDHIHIVSAFGLTDIPVLTIGTGAMASLVRITRSSMLEVIRQDYIRTARAKGQTERKVIISHALRNSMIPIITAIAIQLGSMLGGAIVTETVFAIPGIGMLMIQSIKARDYPTIQGAVVVIAVMFSLLNLVVDIIYTFVDPRLKSIYQTKRKAKHFIAKSET